MFQKACFRKPNQKIHLGRFLHLRLVSLPYTLFYRNIVPPVLRAQCGVDPIPRPCYRHMFALQGDWSCLPSNFAVSISSNLIRSSLKKNAWSAIPPASSSKTTSSPLSKSATAPAASRANWSSPWPISASSAHRCRAMVALAWATSSTGWSLKNSNAATPECAASSACSRRW